MCALLLKMLQGQILRFLIKIAKLIEKAGADRFSFADTVGVLHPAKVSSIFSRLVEEIKIPIHGHFHNDFGLATANALASYSIWCNVR